MHKSNKSQGSRSASSAAVLDRSEIPILNGEVELVDVGDIQPHPANPREADVGALYELIKKNGFYGHCIVQASTRFILVGNHRYQAAVQAGMKHVPVQWVEVDDEHALRILLSDNRSSDLASYNNALLAELLQSRPSLEGTGFDGDALDNLLEDLAHSNAEAEKQLDGERNSGGAPVIQYNIIFDNEVQQRQWFDFLNGLRRVFPEVETIAGRLIRYLGENPVRQD